MPTPKPPYPAAFREQIIELARAGRGLRQLTREFGVSTTTIRHWVQCADGPDSRLAASAASGTPPAGALSQEIAELRRQLRQVQMERDILAKGDEDKKTVRGTVFPRNAWFVGKSERTFTTSSNS